MPYTRSFKILYPAVLGFAAALSVGAAASAMAAERPVAVSPGAASKVALIGDGCPTFSWGAAEGARSYELAVYRIAADSEEAQPVLRETLAGSASSWTPSLERCLERGGRYAWSVRAVGGKEASEWSALSLFEVASGPSEAEFEAALEIVRQFLAVERGGEAEGAAEEDLEVKSEGKAPTPTLGSAVVGTTQLSVDGGVVATSFTGDGSTLTALNPANLASAVQLAQGGTGATDAAEARTNLGVVAGPHTQNCHGRQCSLISFFKSNMVPAGGTSGGADSHVLATALGSCATAADRGRITMVHIASEGDAFCYCGCRSYHGTGGCPDSDVSWQCISE